MAKIDFTAYLFKDHRTLSGSYLARCKKHLAQLPKPNPFQAASNKPQAASCDNLSHLQKKKNR
jgi:hypothetical protein